MSSRNEPVVTARQLLEYKGLLKTVPQSFIVTSFYAVLQLMKYSKIRRLGRIVKDNIFVVHKDDVDVGIVCPSYGAPATVMAIEELIALGVKRFILVGAAGALQPKLNPGSVILSTKAIRDEGISHRYTTPSKYAHASKGLNETIRVSLRENGISYAEGVTWTTDVIYRETKKEVEHYSKSGALCVDMEAAALFAVAKYYNTDASALFYVTDSLANLEWKPYFSSKAMEKSRLLLLKAALDSFGMIKNPHFEIKPFYLNIRGCFYRILNI